MPESPLLHARWFRTVIALFFFFSGAFATFVLFFAGPSLWYIPCAVLWTISGILWLFRPSWAVGFSATPVLGIAVMFVQYSPNFRQWDFMYRILSLCALIALVSIASSFRWPETRQFKPVAVSLVLVLISFSVDRLFTGKVAVVAFPMNWSANGVAPWGDVERDEKGEAPIVVYRKVDGGYCYDAVFSLELKSRLAGTNKSLVSVEYNVFSDFGHKRGYNIRSVDGLIFNKRYRPIRTVESYGGYIMGSNSMDCGR